MSLGEVKATNRDHIHQTKMKTSHTRINEFARLVALASAVLSLSQAQAQSLFTEVADTGDLGMDAAYDMGASWGDFDGDGDVFI